VDEDGFGDVAFRMKFRVYGSSEDHRNAIVTALLGGERADRQEWEWKLLCNSFPNPGGGQRIWQGGFRYIARRDAAGFERGQAGTPDRLE
jgi:hypothetical protein